MGITPGKPDPTATGPGVDKTVSRILSLLLDGVSAAEFEAQLGTIQTESLLGPTDIAAVRTLDARLREAERRQSLLRVLYDTATDLTGIRDVEAVLRAIVRRTRSLIGSDLAYLSLNDYDRGESYIRVTDGAATALFRNIRMPLGEGVLGAVATGEAPSQSPDYLNDTTKTHLGPIDAAVAAEGVKAIMGVPLLAEGRVIGALLVADRHAHNFSSEDVALMESIGTHAAVALENARHFTEMADALSRLDQAQRQNLAHVRTLEELSSLDQRLMETLASPDSISNLLALLTQSLNENVSVVSPMGEPLYGTAPAVDFGSAAALKAAEASAAKAVPVPFEAKGSRYTVMSAVAGDQHLASLVVGGALGPSGLAILERSALVLSAALLFERTYQDAQYRLQLELIDELLNPRPGDVDALKRRAGRFGLADNSPLVVRVVGVNDDQRQRALAVLKGRSPAGPGITALHESHLCVIEPPARQGSGWENPGDTGQALVDTLKRHRIQVTVGSSQPVSGFGRLAAAHAEAHAVLKALTALNRNGEAADRAGLGTAGMLLGAMDSPFAPQLLASQLGPLLEYDSRRGTQLVHTAWTFLENDSSIPRASEALHIHPNTLRQRLERTDGILGGTWRKGGRSLDVHVALRLWRLQSQGVNLDRR